MDYEIPNAIKAKLTDEFYKIMGEELVKVFGITVKTRQDDGFYTIHFVSGTIGWSDAFKVTCEKLNMMDLLDYFAGIDWDEHDQFCGIISEKLAQRWFANG